MVRVGGGWVVLPEFLEKYKKHEHGEQAVKTHEALLKFSADRDAQVHPEGHKNAEGHKSP